MRSRSEAAGRGRGRCALAAEHLADDDAVVQGQDDAGQAVRRNGEAQAEAGRRASSMRSVSWR